MTSYMEDLVNKGYSYDEALAMDEMFRNPRISQDPAMIRGNNGLLFDPGWQLRGVKPIQSDIDLRPSTQPTFIPNPENERIAMGAVSPSLRTETPVTIAKRYRPSTYTRVEPVIPEPVTSDYSHPATEQRSLERSLEEEKLLHTPFQLQPKKLPNPQELAKSLIPNAAATLPTTGYSTLSDDRKAILDAAIAASKTSSVQQTSLPQTSTKSPIVQQKQVTVPQVSKPNPLETYWLDPNNSLNVAYPAAENTDEAITLRNLKKTLSPEEWQQFEEIRQGIAATGAASATLLPLGLPGTAAAATSSSRFLPWVARNIAKWWKNAPEPAKQWFRQALRAEAKNFDKAILTNDVSGLQTILSNPSLIRAMAEPSSKIGQSLMKPIGASSSASSYFSPTVQQLAKWSKWLGWE